MNKYERIVLAAQRDEKLLNEAWNTNHNLIWVIAKCVSVANMEFDDIKSELKLEFLKAVREYDPERGEWANYINTRLNNNVCRLIRHQQAHDRWRGQTWSELDMSESADQLIAPEYPFDWWPIKGLDDKLALIMELRLFHFWKLHEVARVFACSPQYICILEHRAYAKARKLLEAIE